jgi:hypothetical protein
MWVVYHDFMPLTRRTIQAQHNDRLWAALRAGDAETAIQALAAGANPSVCRGEQTPFTKAMASKNALLCEALLDAGCSPKPSEFQSLAYQSREPGMLAVFERVLRSGALATEGVLSGAVSGGSAAAIDMLLDAGAPVIPQNLGHRLPILGWDEKTRNGPPSQRLIASTFAASTPAIDIKIIESLALFPSQWLTHAVLSRPAWLSTNENATRLLFHSLTRHRFELAESVLATGLCRQEPASLPHPGSVLAAAAYSLEWMEKDLLVKLIDAGFTAKIPVPQNDPSARYDPDNPTKARRDIPLILWTFEKSLDKFHSTDEALDYLEIFLSAGSSLDAAWPAPYAGYANAGLLHLALLPHHATLRSKEIALALLTRNPWHDWERARASLLSYAVEVSSHWNVDANLDLCLSSGANPAHLNPDGSTAMHALAANALDPEVDSGSGYPADCLLRVGLRLLELGVSPTGSTDNCAIERMSEHYPEIGSMLQSRWLEISTAPTLPSRRSSPRL